MNQLITLARDSIREQFDPNFKLDLEHYKENFSTAGGIFVTLTIQKQLRGCIGRIVSDEPIYLTVYNMAKQAAFYDHRFLPLTKEEFDTVIIEVSVLSSLEQVASISEIQLGKHGVMLRYKQYSSVFLPKVAVDQGWSLVDLVNHLAIKAGLDMTLIQEASYYVFTADVFSEL